MRHLKIFLIIAIAATSLMVAFSYPHTQVVEVASSQEQPSIPHPAPAFSVLDKLHEGDDLLIATPLKVGTKDIPYKEVRINRDGSKTTTTNQKFAEPEKEIALKLLNLETGDIDIAVITKRGADLISPSNYKIEVMERSSGIRWNKWNTHFRVIEPSNWIVLKNKYPEISYENVKKQVKNKAGKLQTVTVRQQVVEEIIYSPYSDDLHLPELVDGGKEYIDSVVASAQAELIRFGVKSRTLPDQLVGALEVLPARFFKRIPLLEQSDLGEFVLDPQKTADRVRVIIKLNAERAYSLTCSKANACGWVQFTPKTYQAIRKAYPLAKLDSDFERGAANHLNSMKAAILLYDYNLQGFVSRHGKSILYDPRLEEYLAAGYNGRPTTASASLKAAISKGLGDWTQKLKLETKGFMTKLRYLQGEDAS
ncbi:MAG: hypothetical protein Q7S32_01140 [bacterium]|nr:hypothetical protein [bacterium]